MAFRCPRRSNCTVYASLRDKDTICHGVQFGTHPEPWTLCEHWDSAVAPPCDHTWGDRAGNVLRVRECIRCGLVVKSHREVRRHVVALRGGDHDGKLAIVDLGTDGKLKPGATVLVVDHGLEAVLFDGKLPKPGREVIVLIEEED